MNRRRVMPGALATSRALSLLIVLLPLLALAPPIRSALRAAPAPSRPNLIVILTDDQRWDTLRYMPLLRQHLAARGVTFTNAFATTPLCCPSRASLLTGQYARHTGVLSNRPPDGGARAFKDGSTIATWLKAAGYRTGLFGKYLNGYASISPRVPPGWDEWASFVGTEYFNYALNENGTIRRYGTGPDDYSTDVITRRATAFIERTPSQTPFFVYLAPFAPHAPATPAARDAEAFKDLAPWRPPSYNEADVSDKPQFIKRQRVWDAARQASEDAFHRKQVASLQAVDRGVAAVMETLRRTGRLDQTVVIFLSDNGFAWGEHRWNRKGCPYEECIRIPFVVAAPGVPPRQEARLALNIDVAPTLAELAGVRPGAPVDGMSLAPLLRNPAHPWRQAFIIEFWGDDPRDERPDGQADGGGSQRRQFTGVRGERWVYVEYAKGERERELYDLASDPYQMQNLAGNPSHATTLGQMKSLLESLKTGPRGAPVAPRTPAPGSSPAAPAPPRP